MSATKKRKSDVHVNPVENHPHTKKEKWYHEENQPPPIPEGHTRRRFSISGVIKKFKSSSALKVNKPSQEPLSEYVPSHGSINETQISVHSESSVTSVESCNNSLLPNCEKNLGLRTFVNRDSTTPVPPEQQQQLPSSISLPHVGLKKSDAFEDKAEDSISINSHMSIDTIGSSRTIDEDSMSVTSQSIFCTPARLPFARSGNFRLSTRSVDPKMLDESENPLLLRSLCNSVRRIPSTKSDSGHVLANNALRRSLRNNTRRLLNVSNMEDVPEDEPLSTVGSTRHLFTSEAAEEEKFEEGRKFFEKNLTSSTENMEPEEGSCHDSSIVSERCSSNKSESKKTPGAASIGRSSSFFRKVFNGKHPKERRCSEVGNEAIDAAILAGRRSSVVSLSGDISIGETSDANASNPCPSNELSNVPKAKMRKKTHSTSNLTNRLSSVFRRTSSSAQKDDDIFSSFIHNRSNRRSTLTGYSSTSSGIGSIAGSEYGHAAGNGTSVSRNGSKREADAKKEKIRRILDRIVISDIPACDLLNLKLEQKKKHLTKDENEKFETQLNDSVSSTSSALNELLNFDVIAVDVWPNGTPYSDPSKVVIDEKLTKQIAAEIRNQLSSGSAGTIYGCDPDLIFVQHCPVSMGKDLNESVSIVSDLRPDFLPNVRNGVMKAIEEWNKAFPNGNSTLLLWPVFCTSDEEWDSKETIDSIFSMLDALVNAKNKWKAERRCILAGLTPNNVKMLRDKYEELKLSIADTEDMPPNDTTGSIHSELLITNV